MLRSFYIKNSNTLFAKTIIIEWPSTHKEWYNL